MPDWLHQFLLMFNTDAISQFIAAWGWLGYPILFAIIFAETGLLVGCFFPGDSLLFIAGFIASTDVLNIFLLNFLLITAAIVGDSVGYMLGQKSGKYIVFKDNAIFFRSDYLLKTQAFYKKYGGKTIVIARFVPIVRTFAPFVAGLAKMDYKTFISYNVFGGIFWVVSMTLAGYFLGNVPWIKANFEKAVLLIIFISILPVIFELVKSKRNQNKVSHSNQ